MLTRTLTIQQWVRYRGCAPLARASSQSNHGSPVFMNTWPDMETYNLSALQMAVAGLSCEWTQCTVWSARRDPGGTLDRGSGEEAAASSNCATGSEGITDKQRSHDFYAPVLPERDPAVFTDMATVVAATLHISRFDTHNVGLQCWIKFVRHYVNKAA